MLANLSQTYDGTARIPSTTTTPPGLATDITYNDSAAAPTNAGRYTVVATITDPNYQGGTTNTLLVSAAPATVSLGNLTQTYDGTARIASSTTTPPGLATGVTYNGSAAAPTNAGSYTVVATITDPNYQGSATNTLLVSAAPATVSLGNLTQAYDGTARIASATTTPPGLAMDITYNGSAAPPTNVGSYTVIGTITDPNYQGSLTNTLLVSVALSPSSSPDGAFHFSFRGTPGASFTVLAAPDPASSLSNWTAVAGVKETSAGQFEFTDPAATNSAPRFYRVFFAN